MSSNESEGETVNKAYSECVLRTRPEGFERAELLKHPLAVGVARIASLPMGAKWVRVGSSRVSAGKEHVGRGQRTEVRIRG